MKRLQWMVLGIAATLAATGCVSRPERLAEQRCDWPEPVVAASAGAVPVHKFAGIDNKWTLARLFARLGPAQRTLASEPFAYAWDADDGRVFVAAAASRCGLVRRAGFVDPPPPGS
jgi:hypothetical protein